MSRDQAREPQPRRPVAPHELMALRDGVLSPQEEADLYERVENDPSAAALLADLDETDAILQRLRSEGMPTDVSARIERALRAEARQHPRSTEDQGGDGDSDEAPSQCER